MPGAHLPTLSAPDRLAWDPASRAVSRKQAGG